MIPAVVVVPDPCGRLLWRGPRRCGDRDGAGGYVWRCDACLPAGSRLAALGHEIEDFVGVALAMLSWNLALVGLCAAAASARAVELLGCDPTPMDIQDADSGGICVACGAGWHDHAPSRALGSK